MPKVWQIDLQTSLLYNQMSAYVGDFINFPSDISQATANWRVIDVVSVW